MGEFQFGFSGLGKKQGIGCVQIENKIRKKKKIRKELLEVSATGLGFLGQPTCPQVFFLPLGRMTYSHFPNRIFIYL